MITAGKPLFEIDPRNFEMALKAAEAQKAGADAAMDLATAEQSRVRTLVPRGAASREELDVWVAKRNTASAEQVKTKQFDRPGPNSTWSTRGSPPPSAAGSAGRRSTLATWSTWAAATRC